MTKAGKAIREKLNELYRQKAEIFQKIDELRDECKHSKKDVEEQPYGEDQKQFTCMACEKRWVE